MLLGNYSNYLRHFKFALFMKKRYNGIEKYENIVHLVYIF